MDQINNIRRNAAEMWHRFAAYLERSTLLGTVRVERGPMEPHLMRRMSDTAREGDLYVCEANKTIYRHDGHTWRRSSLPFGPGH